MMHCAGCERPILDRFLLNVLDRAWHVKCVQCSDCACGLTEKCFSRDGKLYCRNDFFRRFGTKCAGCSQGISPSDLVRRARNKVFHLKCFTCMICRKQLSTGEELYILDENKFICKEDYLNSKIPGSDDEGDFESHLENQGSLSEKDFSLDGEQSLESKPTLLQSITTNISNNIPSNNDINMMNNATTLTNASLNKSDLSTGSSANSPPPLKDEPMSDSCPSPASPDSNIIGNANPGSNCSSMDINDNNNNKDENGKNTGPGSKRRGPRTTIKAKQLETLKSAFAATPKPTRHIREQLAQETGLNMRVIQVWFQNRRSKERRMKQLSALGARRHFFRSPRRMRALRAGMSPSELDEADMMGPGFGYFNDNGQDFYPGYQGYNDFFPGQVPEGPGNMNFLPPNSRNSPPLAMEHGMHAAGPESQYMHGEIMPPSSSPEPFEEQYGQAGPPRSLASTFATSLAHAHPELASEAW